MVIDFVNCVLELKRTCLEKSIDHVSRVGDEIFDVIVGFIKEDTLEDDFDFFSIYRNLENSNTLLRGCVRIFSYRIEIK